MRGHQFHRGERMSMAYRNRQHAMDNWQARHLNAPAQGQQWVQVGTDYALIAIATGVIAQLVLNRQDRLSGPGLHSGPLWF